METLSFEALGASGAIAALVVGLVLWKVLKFALKVVIFLVLMGALGVGAAVYLERNPQALPPPPAAR